MKKKLFSILLSLSVMLIGILAMSTTAMAATDEVTGIQAEQTVDTSSGNIKVTLKVTAENEYNIEGLALENKAPNGYKLFSGEATKKIAKLKSGESEILTTVFTKESGAVKTGDSNSNHMLMYGGIAVLSAALIVLLLSRKKGRNKVFMLLLCCVMVASGVVAFTGEGFAGEGNQINLSKNVTVGSETVTVNSVVSYDSVVQNKYNVTAQVQGDHGTATVKVGDEEVSTAAYDSSVVFSATPQDGYEFDHWEVVSGGITLEDATVNPITVTMPANALTLKAYFKVAVPSAYGIIVEDDGHGTAKAQVGGVDKTSAAPGASVTLSATPKDGYAFKEWKIISGLVSGAITGNTFTMPDNNVKVKAIFEKEYTVTVEAQGHGTARSDVAKGVSGKEVTLTAEPEDGYHFKEWTVVSGGVTVTSDKFTIGTADVKVKAIFEKDALTITVEDDGHGSGVAKVNEQEVTTAAKGATVTLKATPKDGYAFKEWKVVSGLASGAINNNSFTMPDNNVKVKAVFERVYNITLQTNEHGTVSATVGGKTATTAPADAEVTLTAEPAEGYQFKTWKVVSGGVSVTENKFTMPEKNVTIMAVFESVVPVTYMDWNPNEKKLVEKSTSDYTEVTNSTTTLDGGKFYVVKGTVNTGGLTVNGTIDNPTTLIICDGAKLTATGGGQKAGINVASGNALTITVQSGGIGELSASGGMFGAGIGGGNQGNGGTVTINGGTVTATGGSGGAGIGGGRKGAGGTVTINGGTVKATSVMNGAGIGGGSYGVGGTVTINGGTVTATGGTQGAGIGGGLSYAGGTVTINGGTVTATGGKEAAGIGGSCAGSGGEVTINCGTVTATGGSGGSAGIGGGYGGVGGTVTINGGTVTATGNDGGAGIGAGKDQRTNDGTVTFKNDVTFAIKAGADAASATTKTAAEYANDHSAAYVHIEESAAPAEIKYMDWDNDEKKLVEKSTFDYTEVTNSTTTLDGGKFYVVKGEDVKTGTLTVSGDGAATLILADGAKLTATGSDNEAGINVASGNALTITGQSVGTGELIALGGDYGAGIGGGNTQACGTVTINGGTVTATVQDQGTGAGIGGGYNGAGGTVTINGGTVTATGVSSAAGIGGGYNGAGGTVTINGGTVTATNQNNWGAGIGGGYNCAGGTVTINGGTVNATGGLQSAGIGGGYKGDGGTVTINGGTVTATGGNAGAGIGGGYKGAGGTVTINGGTVTATGKSGSAGIGNGAAGNSGTVTFKEGVTFNVKAGAAAPGEDTNTTDYSNNHNAAYVHIEVYSCFVAGTQVQCDLAGNTKNIEDFKVGDDIVSYNVNTGEYYLAKVNRLFIHDGAQQTTQLVDMTLENGTVITMTANHPILTQDGFKSVSGKSALTAEDKVLVDGEWIDIRDIKVYSCNPTTTYNIDVIDLEEIEDDNTFDTYIAGGTVVHNKPE